MTTGPAVIRLPDGSEYELPFVKSTIGESGFDATSFLKDSGHLLYDPSFMSTASCKSSITYINGNEGVLMHRGYPIQHLTQNQDFTDCIYLLLNSTLPTDSESEELSRSLVQNMKVTQRVRDVIGNFPRNAHPMSMLMAASAALASECEKDYKPNDTKYLNELSLLAIPAIIASGIFIYRYISGQRFIEADTSTGFTDNIVEMLLEGNANYSKTKSQARDAFNRVLILHMDHEQNASTSTVRMVASTEVNLFAAISSGICALWGKLHGGANEAVVRMLHQIDKIEHIPQYIDRAKDREDPFRLMGFGHRVYKNYDPRAEVLKSACDSLLASLESGSAETLEIARRLESCALSDQYFIDRNLFPNVDFYSGIIYEAFSISPSFFTVIFAMSRIVGWTVQSLEFLSTHRRKISRPRQIYIGNVQE